VRRTGRGREWTGEANMNATSGQSATLDIDLAAPAALGSDFSARLSAIREAEPVFWSEAQHGWFVTRYADVAEGFGGKLPLSNVRLGKLAFAAIPEEEWPRRVPLLTSATPTFANMTDPPYHSRLRPPMNAAFSKSGVETMRQFVRQRLQALLDAAEQPDELEFIESIARPLTGSVIMQLMGVPEENLGNLRDWANAIVMALGTARPSAELLADGERAMREMDNVFQAEIARRKLTPMDDFLSVLAAASAGDAGLTHAELLGTCVNTLLAGHESTASTMAMGVAALAAHPRQIEYMLANPDRKLALAEEISRYVAMSASMTRIAT
jgi:pimeloyl-[acyl-carrier protein] synthase